MTARRTILLLVTGALVGGCCRSKTIRVAPIHITVDATARHGEALEQSPGLVDHLVEASADKLNTTGALTSKLMTGCILCYSEHGRWPADLTEIRTQLKEAGQAPTGLEAVQTVEIKTTQDGSLEVRYKADGQAESWLRLSRPAP